MKLLYIEASPREADSSSRHVSETYLAELQAAIPGLDVDALDLWQEELPPFDQTKVAAKMAVIARQEFTAVQRAAWDEVTAIAGRFLSADRYLFAVPMWNSGIPYRLKHYIDIVHQPGVTWTLNPQHGYTGLVTGKHATLVLTSGVFAPGVADTFGIDHHGTYLHDWLREAGVTDVDDIRYQPTILTPDPAGGLEKAKGDALELAKRHSREIAAMGIAGRTPHGRSQID